MRSSANMGQRAGKVGGEEEGPLQRGDEDWVELCVVGGDLASELVHARLDLLGGEIRLADLRPVV